MSDCKNRVEININLSCDHSEKIEEKYNNVQKKPNIFFGYLLSCFIGMILTFGSELEIGDLTKITKETYIILVVFVVVVLCILAFKKNTYKFNYIYGECLQVLALNISLLFFLVIKWKFKSCFLYAILSVIVVAFIYYCLFCYENYGAKSSGKNKV